MIVVGKRARQLIAVYRNITNQVLTDVLILLLEFDLFQIDHPFLIRFASGRMPITMKLDTPEFKKLFTPQLHKLSNLFQEYNYELRSYFVCLDFNLSFQNCWRRGARFDDGHPAS